MYVRQAGGSSLQSDLSFAKLRPVPFWAKGYKLSQSARLSAAFIGDSTTSACIREKYHQAWKVAEVLVHDEGIVADLFIVVEACCLVHIEAVKVQLGKKWTY